MNAHRHLGGGGRRRGRGGGSVPLDTDGAVPLPVETLANQAAVVDRVAPSAKKIVMKSVIVHGMGSILHELAA